MTIAFVQFKKATSTAATSITATFDSSTTAGNLLHADAADFGGPTSTTVSDTLSNTWASANARNNFSSNWAVQQAYAKNIASAGSSHGVVLTSSLGALYLSLAATEISGADTTAPLDKNAANNVTGTAQTVSSGTISQADEILMGGLCWDSISSDTVTIDSNYTATYDSAGVQPKLATGYRVVSSISSYTYACTISPSRVGRSTIATYKAAAGGASVAPWAHRFSRVGGTGPHVS